MLDALGGSVANPEQPGPDGDGTRSHHDHADAVPRLRD
jgi:hypothetical protein